MLSDSLVESFRAQLAAVGLELADLRIGGTQARPLAQVRIEGPRRDGAGGGGGEVCGGGGGGWKAWLGAGGPWGPRYVLGVWGRGLARPLRWHRHWLRFVGREV